MESTAPATAGPPVVFSSEDAPSESTLTQEAVGEMAIGILRTNAVPATAQSIADNLREGGTFVPIGRLIHVLDGLTEGAQPRLRSMMLGDPPQRIHYVLTTSSGPEAAHAALLVTLCGVQEDIGDETGLTGMTLDEIVKAMQTKMPGLSQADIADGLTALSINGKVKSRTVKGRKNEDGSVYVYTSTASSGAVDVSVYDIANGVLHEMVMRGAASITGADSMDRSGFERTLAETLDKERGEHTNTRRERDALCAWLRDHNVNDAGIDAILNPPKPNKKQDAQPVTTDADRKTFLWSKRVPMDDKGKAALFVRYLELVHEEDVLRSNVDYAKAALKDANVKQEKEGVRIRDEKDALQQSMHDATRLEERVAYKMIDWSTGEEVILDDSTGEVLERKPLPKGAQTQIPGLTGVMVKIPGATTLAWLATAQEGGKEAPAGNTTPDIAKAAPEAQEPAARRRAGGKAADYVEPLFNMIDTYGNPSKAGLSSIYAEQHCLADSDSLEKLLMAALDKLVKAGRVVVEKDVIRVPVADSP